MREKRKWWRGVEESEEKEMRKFSLKEKMREWLVMRKKMRHMQKERERERNECEWEERNVWKSQDSHIWLQINELDCLWLDRNLWFGFETNLLEGRNEGVWFKWWWNVEDGDVVWDSGGREWSEILESGAILVVVDEFDVMDIEVLITFEFNPLLDEDVDECFL